MVKGILLSIILLSFLVFIGLGASALADDQLLFSSNPKLDVAVTNQTTAPIWVNGVELNSGASTQPVSISSVSTLKLPNHTIALEYNSIEHTLELSPANTTAQNDHYCIHVNDATITLTQHQIINIQSATVNSVKLNIVSCGI